MVDEEPAQIICEASAVHEAEYSGEHRPVVLVRGKPVGVSVFNTQPDGSAIVDNFTLPASVAGVTDVLVTEEPAGGSPQPTTTPFIGGKMPAEAH